MKILESIDSVKSLVHLHKTANKSIGFVPTMGALHAGHLSLCQYATNNNDITIVSIFVNPTQFNDQNDLKNYPTPLQQDIEKLEKNNIDYLFLPQYKEIYADGYNYQVQENNFSTVLEGEHRPGHFNGVLTIVLKLNNLIQPNNLYLGEKDYQQAKLIKDMFKAFFIDTNIVICPTVRDQYGLALSSRNSLLSEDELELSRKLNHYLKSSTEINSIIKKLERENIKVEYIQDYQGRRLAAVKIGNVRLIDNIDISEFI